MSKKSDRGTARPKAEEPRHPTSEPEEKPCGCIETVFSDDTADIVPCVPHGLMQAAQSLLTAGNAIGAVGAKLFNEDLRLRTEMANQLANRVVEDCNAADD
jgi:hypothetical protein